MKTRSQEAVHRMAIHADAIKKGTASGALAVERCNAGDVEGALQARVEAEEHWTLAGRDATQELAAVDRLIAARARQDNENISPAPNKNMETKQTKIKARELPASSLQPPWFRQGISWYELIRIF